MAPADLTPTKALDIWTQLLTRQDVQITPTATSSGGGSNLSGGAIAGIVIGVVAFLVIVGVIGRFILYRREKTFKREAAIDDKAAARQQQEPGQGQRQVVG
jgi:hypothetical protein